MLRWGRSATGRSAGEPMHPTDTATPHKPQPFSFLGRRCVSGPVSGSATIALCGVLLAWAGACGRTQLEPAAPRDAAALVDRPADLARDLGGDQKDALPDLSPDLPMETLPEPPPDDGGGGGPPCIPTIEECNGKDDDCDGVIDEEQPGIPCPNGGFRYCVGGTYSDCRVRCDACVPGSRRVCFRTFCTYWGVQYCAEDGRTFGPCMEAPVPQECKKISEDKQRSRELEQCCLDNNYCCRDEFDLDHDNDTGEMLGRCEAVMCTP